jgi:hypothetical protein
MTPSNRRTYIDWARGIAVLLMIEAHTMDAWTRPADKSSIVYSVTRDLGGFAAPLFLWLAGVGVALAASRTAERTGSRATAVEDDVPRAASRFSCCVSVPPAGVHRQPAEHAAQAVSRRHPECHGAGDGRRGAGLGIGSRRRARAWRVRRSSPRRSRCSRRSCARSPLVDRLPIWFQWYVRPAGEFTTFTLFPWAGSCSRAPPWACSLAASRADAAERRLQIGCGIAGVLLIAGGFARGAAVDLSKLVVLDELADVVRHSRRHLDARVRLCFVAERISHEIAKARNPNGLYALSCFRGRLRWRKWAGVAVHLLDSRRAGLRLRELVWAGHSRSGVRSRPSRLLRGHVRRRSAARPRRRQLA